MRSPLLTQIYVTQHMEGPNHLLTCDIEMITSSVHFFALEADIILLSPFGISAGGIS